MKILYTLLLLLVSLSAFAQYEVVKTNEVLLAGQTYTITSSSFTEGTIIRKSVMQHQNPLRVLVYPNPATEYIQLDSEGVGRYQILNILGKTVQQGEFGYQDRINVEKLPEGMYVLRVMGGSSVAIKKIMIRE